MTLRRSRTRAALAAPLTAVCALAVLPALGGSATATDPAGAGARAVPRIMVIGDSQAIQTAGVWTWRYRLDRHLRSNGVGFDLVGPRTDLHDTINNVDGSQAYVDRNFDRDHAGRWGGGMGYFKGVVKDVGQRYQPDVYVVMAGTNDLRYGVSPADTIEHARVFIHNARLATPDADFVMIEPPHWYWPGETEYGDLLPGFAQAQSSPGSRVVIAPTQASFRASDTFDGSHANARGELKIAAAVADALHVLGIGPRYRRPLPQVAIGPRWPATVSGRSWNRTVQIDYKSAPGVDREYIWVRNVTRKGAWWRRGVTAPATQNRVFVQNLRNGDTYRFKLQPAKGSALSPDIRSRVITQVPRLDAPAAPKVSIGPAGYARIDWAAVWGARSYQVLRRIGQGRWQIVGRTQATALGLGKHRSGWSYAFKVRGIDETGVRGKESPAVRVTAPRLPDPGRRPKTPAAAG